MRLEQLWRETVKESINSIKEKGEENQKILARIDTDLAVQTATLKHIEQSLLVQVDVLRKAVDEIQTQHQSRVDEVRGDLTVIADKVKDLEDFRREFRTVWAFLGYIIVLVGGISGIISILLQLQKLINGG